MIDLSHPAAGNGDIHFISDLHLDPQQSETLALSQRYFSQSKQASALFIIGDLFEYWLGDDAVDPRLTETINALKELTAAGCKTFLMHGNRDFLIGEAFAESVGATLLREDHVQVIIADQRLSLLHGDTLCSDDVDYQKLRQLVRHPEWQSTFLSLTIEERLKEAQALRDKSRDATAGKQTSIMDVSGDAVAAHCKANACDCLIHGHTHRPEDHTDEPTRRVVLGNWHADHAMVARFSNNRLLFEQFS